MKKKRKPKYYAYSIISENKTAIVDNWKDCEKKVKGTNANYKGFKTKKEAQEWLDKGAKYEKNNKAIKKKQIKKTTLKNFKLKEGIYFDAGTGRGEGVEVRITNKKSISLIEKFNFKNNKVNRHKNYHLGKTVTNNYGELVGCYLALKLAIKTNTKEIFGDSKLILDFWSKNIFKQDLPDKTKEMIIKVVQLRKKYEKQNGKLTHISGDINPADLGFHK